MIHIKKPTINTNNNTSRCNCDIYVNDEKRTIWYDVPSEYEQYLCTERSDAYVIGLFNWCLRENHDIEVEAPITDELLFNLTTILMPALVKYADGRLHTIKIIGPQAPALQCGKAVGTGCSCGVDSFTAIYNHINTNLPQFDITHLCINNVGAYNECYESYGADKVKQERYNKTRELISQFHDRFKYIETDSNFMQEFPQNHFLTHTFSSVFAVYMLQKLWKVYYYASAGEGYEIFSLHDNDVNDAARYELLSLACFSHSYLRVYSESAELTRLEKTQLIADKSIVQNFLHVCTAAPYNCGVCGKCRRTLVTLDYLGKLKHFQNVFNVDYYYNHKAEYYIWLYQMHLQNDLMNEPVYQAFLTRSDFCETIKKYRQKQKRVQLVSKIKWLCPPFCRKIIKKVFAFLK